MGEDLGQTSRNELPACAVATSYGTRMIVSVATAGVEEPERRSWIAVARLADGAAVHQILRRRLELRRSVHPAAARRERRSLSELNTAGTCVCPNRQSGRARRETGAPGIEVVEDVDVLVER